MPSAICGLPLLLLLLWMTEQGIARHHRKTWQLVNVPALRHERPGKEALCAGRKEGFFRHPRDCHLFVRCVDVFGSGRSFSAFQGRCEPGLVFDDGVSACNWPELAAPCHGERPGPEKLIVIGAPVEPEPTHPPKKKKNCLHKPGEQHEEPLSQKLDAEEDPQPEHPRQVAVNWWIPEDGQLVLDNEETVLTEEPILCKGEGFFREPGNCSRFFRCEASSEGGPFAVHRFECPRNLVFDELREACVQLRDTDLTEICTTVRSRNKRSPPGGAPPRCEREGFFRHPRDCRAFFRCVATPGGALRPHLFSCAGGLVFDEEASSCNWPYAAAPCTSTTSAARSPLRTHQSSTRTPSTRPPSGESRIRPQSGNKRNDFIDQGKLIPVHTQSTPKPTPTLAKPSSVPKCKKPGLFADPENCRRFFQCVNNGNRFVRYELECPGTTSFDAKGGRCSTARNCRRPTPPLRDEEMTTEATDGGATTRSSASTKENDASSGDNDIVCVEEGYFRHPEDCNKFYRCVDFKGSGESYVRYDFNCPEGLVFDETNSVCNWPAQSPPCNGGGITSGEDKSSSSEEVSATETTHSEGGVDPTTTAGAQTSTSSSRLETTESPSPGESTTTDAQTGPSRTTDASEQTTDSSTATTSDPDSSTSSGNPGECTEAGYFRNPEDCSKFYRCVDFKGTGESYVRYDFSCPEGLVFDEVNSVCNWPDQSPPCEGDGGNESKETESTAGEESSSEGRETQPSTEKETEQTSPPSAATERTTESTTTTTTDESSSSDDHTGTSSETGSSRPPSSNIECTEEGFFRHPEDCNKFYRCVDFKGSGESYVRYDFDCPEGLVFDEVNSVCNWPDQSPACDSSGGGSSNVPEEEQVATDSTTDQQTSQQSTSSAQSSTTSDSTTTTTTGSTTAASSTTTSDDCTEEGFFRDPEDCRRFHRCVQNESEIVRYDLECPEGLIFDERNETCEWPSESNRCESGSQKDSDCTEEGFFADPHDCRKYYRCLKSDTNNSSFDKTEFSCNEDEVFDDNMKFCNRADPDSPCEPFSPGETTDTSSMTPTTTEVTRGSSGETESPSRETEGPSQGTESPKETEGPSQGTESPKETEGPSQETDGPSTATSNGSKRIECTEEGFFRHPEDCNKFYRCVDFKGDGQSYVRYDFDCPEGLVFDEVNSVCNWPTMTPACETSAPSDRDKGETSNPENGSSSTESFPTTSSSTESSSSIPSSTATEDETESSSRPEEESSSTTEQTSSDSRSSRQPSSNIECTEEGFFRHPEDCNKFYRCVDFKGSGESYVRYDFDCPEGLVFDEVNSVCNWPNQSPACDTSGGGSSDGSKEQSSTVVTTEEQTVAESTTATQPAQSSVTSDSTTMTDSIRTTASGGTTFDCTEEGFFRDPEDCRRYYQCSRDESSDELQKSEFECPEGHIFDEQSRYCNAEELSEQSCGGQGSGGTGGFRCEEEGFFRDPEDCGAYFQCTKNEDGGFDVKRIECPEGHVFDENGRYCNAEELNEDTCRNGSDSERGGSSTTSNNGLGSGDSSTECTEEGFFRDPNDCRRYYQCETAGSGFDRSEHTCPEGHVFDEEGRYCNAEELSEQPCNTTSSDTTTRASTVDMTSSSMVDTTTASADTTTASADTTTASTDTTTASTDTTTASVTSDTNTSEAQQGTSSAKRGGKGECTEEGFFRNPEDCNKFYRCVDFRGDGQSYVRYDFDCPEGLVFDEVNSVCNWPDQSPACESV